MQLHHEYTIELATPAHVPLLAAIEIAAAGIFPPGSIPEHIRSDSVPESVLLEAVQKGLLWVALVGGGRPVGYCLVQLIQDAALLAQMDVHPDHMCKGIGSALVAHVTDYLKLHEKAAFYLTTFTHVPWNAPFYAKLGFEVLNKEEIPLFLNMILDEEKRYGLTSRVAMRLNIQ
ncbi:MAG: GNAT family N-acetyltransferase [Desulfovibrionaceae bacterium]